MAQPEWLATVNPDVLLNILHPTGTWLSVQAPPPPETTRRLRLFACACARMVWDFLPTDARSAVLIRERFAEGRATEADVRASAVRFAKGAEFSQLYAMNAAVADPSDAARSAAKALASRAAGSAPPGRPTTPEWGTAWSAVYNAARTHQAELVRDIFPPPGYAPRLEPDWRTSTVVALAQQMDSSGDFSAVPILADAIQDAGCYDEVMLDRCRARSQVHCRGNWVVDLVLGRE